VHYRPLGRTGLPVSEIGYGAWGIGGSMWIGAREDESIRAPAARGFHVTIR
jgi:aryl-alcohol dehydrogenase-like predicted oxidoreductase